jgi:hypothetical protein
VQRGKTLLMLLRVAATLGALCVAVCCFFWPAAVTLRTVYDLQIDRKDRPSAFASWFGATARRYDGWAADYLASQRAGRVDAQDVAATEWPMFGSVFFLLSAEELLKTGQVQRNAELDSALRHAAQVVADPTTATWVRRKWGASYLRRENVFYRMLLILGLSTYERATGDRTYHSVAMDQARTLSAELERAPHHLADDYPGECYPSDVLWAVAAIGRAGTLEDFRSHTLTAGVLEVMDGRIRTERGLPAAQVDSRTALITQPARGSGNSGILSFAAELDANRAARWFEAYVKHYWQSGFIQGFREVAPTAEQIVDVDSGPVIAGIGSVASVFGIGAARTLGRYDYAAPLTMEAVAASWPTPFGLLLPGLLGLIAADGWCFGELALHFAMTRPNYTSQAVAYDGRTPGIVWALIAMYLLGGIALVTCEVHYWLKFVASRSPTA